MSRVYSYIDTTKGLISGGSSNLSLVDLDTASPAIAFRVLREGKLLFCRNPPHVADVLQRMLIRSPEVRSLIREGLGGGRGGARENRLRPRV